jgi:hypothetical protein
MLKTKIQNTESLVRQLADRAFFIRALRRLAEEAST